MLPPLIVNRRTKGRLEGLYVETFERQRGDIGRILSDGRLAAAGIIDMDAVQQLLVARVEPNDTGFFRLLQFVGIEFWLASIEALQRDNSRERQANARQR